MTRSWYSCFLALGMITVLALVAAPAFAQSKYDPGASDTEIKIGNFCPQTGWLSEYGATATAEAAYFQMVNDRGGINGRKINFISRDTASDARKATELAHQLVEQDQVLLLFGCVGLSTNLDIRPYMNEKKVPQLFVASPASIFNDPAHFPWTMGFQASAKTEASIYAKYILQFKPNAKIAVLYANDANGKDYLAGLHEGLGDKAATMIVKELSYEDTDPFIDTQMADLKASGADTFCNFTVGKYTTTAIRKTFDLDWRPLQFVPNTSLSIAAFLDPAGLEKSVGIISSARSKGWLTTQDREDADARHFLDWMAKYNPKANLRDAANVYGYEAAETMVEVLKKCGNDLTRANVLAQATSLDLKIPMLLPEIKVTTSPTDYRPIKQLYLIKFDGKNWKQFGNVIGG